MPPETHSRDDLWSSAPTALLGAGLCLAVAACFLLAAARGRWPGFRWPLHALGFAAASAGCWFAFQFLARFLHLATSWPLLGVALLGGFAVEAILWLYRFETGLVTRRRGRALLTLRLIALLALLAVLVEPVHSFLETREINREIAVLLDDSLSMRIADQRLDASETLDRAALFGVNAVEKRPPFSTLSRQVEELDHALRTEREAMASAPSAKAGLANREEQLPAFFENVRESNRALVSTLVELAKNDLPEEAKRRVNDHLRRGRDQLPRILDAAERDADEGKATAFVKQLGAALEELAAMKATLDDTALRADEHFLASLGDEARAAIEAAAARPRDRVAREILLGESALPPSVKDDERNPDQAANPEGRTLRDRLAQSYNLKTYRFARDLEEMAEGTLLAEPEPEGSPGDDPDPSDGPEPVAAGENDAPDAAPGTNPDEAKPSPAPPDARDDPALAQTDLAGALDEVLERTPPEALAGVLLLSDGRHNGADLPEDALRRLAARNAPLNAVPVGGRRGPVDISLLRLDAPESLYLDDRLVVRAEAKIDGLRGEEIRAELLADGDVVAEETLTAEDVTTRAELRFEHVPETKGIHDYQLRLQPDERELFQENNHWDFKVAVTDDRTNVLLVDDYPRWEFRYLRNLFYGRDKSVHLQYVLLHPDRIDRAVLQPPVPASATRPFGEAEATRLPENPEEWNLFDVIILGDLPPSALSIRDWRAIEEAVTQRGALLVCVAGTQHMPRSHDLDILQRLLPVTWEKGDAIAGSETGAATAASPYRIHLTAAGDAHAVTSQSPSIALNRERWSGFPPLRWRFVPVGVKESAEVLAYAQPAAGGKATAGGNGGPALANGDPDSVEAAIQRLARQKDLERENALIVTQRAGLGKVLMMNFDRTWRFRYGVGDTYHHRFWGQVTRWGAGENLRSGNELARLGTDRLSYLPGDPVEVTAKLLDPERRPVTDAELHASVYRGEERILRQRMSYRSNSSGLYETSFENLGQEGEYRIELEGEAVGAALAARARPEGPESIGTELLVVSTRNPVELAELTADRDFLDRAATTANGRVAELGRLDSLLAAFGAPRETLTERRHLTLWDQWPLLVLFLGCLTAEWVLRRMGGLV